MEWPPVSMGPLGSAQTPDDIFNNLTMAPSAQPQCWQMLISKGAPGSFDLSFAFTLANAYQSQLSAISPPSVVNYRSTITVPVQLSEAVSKTGSPSLFNDGYTSISASTSTSSPVVPSSGATTMMGPALMLTVLPSPTIGSTWMGELAQKNPAVTMAQMVIPGSHDSGMSTSNSCPFIPSSTVETQSLTVLGQMQAGVRYFDLRPYETTPGGFSTGHYGGWGGCLGQGLTQILDQVEQFLQSNPTESVFLSFSHTQADFGTNPSGVTNPVSDVFQFVTQYPGLPVFTNPTGQLLNVPLTHLQGSAVLLFDSDYAGQALQTSGGSYRAFLQSNCNETSGCSSASGAGTVYLYDRYSNSYWSGVVVPDQLGKFSQFGQLNQSYIFLLSWTATGGLGPTLPIDGVLDPLGGTLGPAGSAIWNQMMPLLTAQANISNMAAPLDAMIPATIGSMLTNNNNKAAIQSAISSMSFNGGTTQVTKTLLPNIFYYDYVTAPLDAVIIGSNF